MNNRCVTHCCGLLGADSQLLWESQESEGRGLPGVLIPNHTTGSFRLKLCPFQQP